MRAVLVEHQPLARHDVEHAVRHRRRHEAAVGAAAVARPAALVLRPQAVQHEGERPARARAALRVAPLLADVGAVGRAPRQRQQVIVEHARLVLPPRAIAIVVVAVVGFRALAVGRPLGRRVAGGEAQNDQNGGETREPRARSEVGRHCRLPDGCMRKQCKPQAANKARTIMRSVAVSCERRIRRRAELERMRDHDARTRMPPAASLGQLGEDARPAARALAEAR